VSRLKKFHQPLPEIKNDAALSCETSKTSRKSQPHPCGLQFSHRIRTVFCIRAAAIIHKSKVLLIEKNVLIEFRPQPLI
jgi:hypothetical protein